MINPSSRGDGAATENTDQTKSERRTANWNYAVFLAQGIVANASKSIGSARLLLPYLYVATGSPVFLAGMLMPIVSGSRLVGQVVAAPYVSAARGRKWILFAGWMMTAAGLAAAAWSASIADHWVVMLIFASASVAMGLAKGINGLAFNDLMSLNLSKSRRNSGLYLMSAAAGVVTIAVTWSIYELSEGDKSVVHYVNLAIAAAAVTAVAAVIIVFFREVKVAPKTPRGEAGEGHPRRETKPSLFVRMEKFRDVLQFRWFRRYLYMRCLTTTVIVAMPFYAVHGATHHADKNASGLSAFVIATSVAVIIAGPIWQRVGKRSQRVAMALGSALVGVAGMWALAIDEVSSLQTVLAHCFVFGMAAAGIQAVNQSRMLFLIDAAPKEELTYYVAVTNTVSAILALVVAAFFGYIAQIQGVIWPVILVAILNFIAAAYSLTLKEPSSGETNGVSQGAESAAKP
ncbi:MAG: MFS transporter [Pseudomonadota bacterium]